MVFPGSRPDHSRSGRIALGCQLLQRCLQLQVVSPVRAGTFGRAGHAALVRPVSAKNAAAKALRLPAAAARACH